MLEWLSKTHETTLWQSFLATFVSIVLSCGIILLYIEFIEWRARRRTRRPPPRE